jgi:perosamine synthetase
MTNLQAAVGLAQLERLDEFVDRKRRMGARYSKQLSEVESFQLPLAGTDYADNVYWVYGIVLHDDFRMDALSAMSHLAEQGIGTRPFFYPMHRQPVLRKLGIVGDERLPVSERLAERGFYVPSGMALRNEQIDFVCQKLLEMAT